MRSRFLFSPEDGAAGETPTQANDSGEERKGAEATSEAETAEIAQFRAELAAANAKAAESHDRLLRVAADFDNARKRWERERDEVRQYASSEFARDLLPVIDAFEKAISAIGEAQFSHDTEEGKKMAAIVEGIQLVSKSFEDAFKKHGIERVPGKGQPFNPKYHNAVARVVDTSLKQDMVIDEFVPGYKIGERVLRTAMVRVATCQE